MKAAVLFAGVLFTVAAQAETITWRVDHDELGLKNQVQEVATPDTVEETLRNALRNTSGNAKPEEIVLIEQVINLGREIWKIIEKNKPVVDVKYHYANAVPKGIKSTEELEGFSPLQTRSFRMHGKNPYGITVYDVTYTLVHRYGGSYQGRGRYLDAVTVLPHKLDVMWGYKVNFGVERVSTVNSGTSRDPVASILMEMNFQVNTVVKSSQFRGVYEFRGDSARVTSIQN